MTTPSPHSWSISNFDEPAIEHTTGTANDHSDALLRALAAARTALLSGQLAEVAVTIDGDTDTHISPGRDATGAIDADSLTMSLVDLYHASTAGEVAAWICAR